MLKLNNEDVLMYYKRYANIFLVIIIFLNCSIYLKYVYANESNEQTNPKQQKVRFPFSPGDALKITTFPDTTSFLHNKTFPIDDRGLVDFPIINKVNVSKMTTEQIISFLKDTYKSYLRSPNISVKPVVRISLLGGFARPGLYYVDIDNSLWEVIRLSGGPILDKGIDKMKWERNGDEQKGDLTEYFESGISLRRMGFRSGDLILTPSPDARTFWDTVNNFMPFITLATTITLTYMTYQQSIWQIQYRR